MHTKTTDVKENSMGNVDKKPAKMKIIIGMFAELPKMQQFITRRYTKHIAGYISTAKSQRYQNSEWFLQMPQNTPNQAIKTQFKTILGTILYTI